MDELFVGLKDFQRIAVFYREGAGRLKLRNFMLPVIQTANKLSS